jgi:hypothetical protein
MSNGTYSTTDKSTQVVDIPSVIASHCGRGEQSGNDWKCNCPICGKHSLSITYGQKIPILLRCWYCASNGLNDGWTEQRAYLIEAGLLEPHFRDFKNDGKKLEEYKTQQHAKAKEIWDSAEAIELGSTQADYLRGRGLESFIGHPALRRHRVNYSILIARVWNVQYGFTAVQLTFLQWDDQFNVTRDKGQNRKTIGPLKGGAVWIGRPREGEEVVVAEGIETVLSAMLLMDLKCGAAVLGVDNMRSLILPRDVRKVLIAADNDETGRGAASHTARLWRGQGLQVRVSVPDIEGEDFNDVLLRKGAGL